MADAFVDIDGGGNILEILRKINADIGRIDKSVDTLEKNTATSFGKIGKSLSAVKFASITQNIQNVSQGLNDLSRGGLSFGSSMAELQVITGVSGKQLDELGDKARDNALKFGGDASKSLESYKILLSKLGPELARAPKQLDAMANSTAILSKQMKNDNVAAANLSSIAMNQYSVSLDNPTKASKTMLSMINAMTASAAEGSEELPELGQGIENVGADANAAGLKFEEMLSSLQALDKFGGKSGAEGGIALRNAIATMNQGRFIPKEVRESLIAAGIDVNALGDKTIKFTDRLRMLKPVLNDSALLSKFFGKENQLGAAALIRSADAQDKMTKAITGTKNAENGAKIAMETKAEKLARMNARIEDYKISIFEATGGTIAFAEPISQVAVTISSFAPIFSGAVKMVQFFTKSNKEAAASTSNLNTQTTRSRDAMGRFSRSSSQAGAAVQSVGNRSQRAASMMKGMGGALKAVGWAAAISAVAALATRFADVASGANEARIRIEEFQKGVAQGEKKGQKIVTKQQKTLDKELADIQNLQTAGDISKKTADQRKLKALEKALSDAQFEKSYIPYERENAKKELKKAEKEFQESGFGEGLKQTFGIKGKTDKAAMKRGYLAEIDAKDKELMAYIEDLSSQISAQNAEIKGGKKGSLVSAGGYGDSKASEITGKGEVKRIDVRIENLVKGDLIFQKTVGENLQDLKKLITETLIGAVRDVEIAL